MGGMGLDSTLNIAHRACAKYSTLNKITHVNCAKTGDMEIAHVNVLEIAHHFSLCVRDQDYRNYQKHHHFAQYIASYIRMLYLTRFVRIQ